MRFSVRWLDVCPGKEKRILWKSAFYDCCDTKKRILCVSYGKSHVSQSFRCQTYCHAFMRAAWQA